jgi:dihydrolipoamide dehydrogenase
LGLELAQALARLDVKTEVFEQSDHLGGLHDAEVARQLGAILGAEFPIHLGVKLGVAREDDAAHVTWSGASAGSTSFERVLVAAGRPPELKHLNMQSTGLSLDDRGIPRFDAATLQCGNAPIFLAGDVDGQRPVLHEASAEGAIAGRNAALFPNVRPGKRATPLSIMFTDPPLATIGAQPSKTTIVGTGSYAQQGRAKVEARTEGLVRIYAEPINGALTGAILLGPGMDHICHLVAWAIEREETASRLLALPFYHPTLEEGLKPALRDICQAMPVHEAERLECLAPPGA